LFFINRFSLLVGLLDLPPRMLKTALFLKRYNLKESTKKKYKFKIVHTFGFLLTLAILLGFFGFILRIIDKIRSGHGLDYYFTGHGIQMNYIGALIILSIIPLVLLFAWIIKIIMTKKEDLEIENYRKSRLLNKKIKK